MLFEYLIGKYKQLSHTIQCTRVRSSGQISPCVHIQVNSNEALRQREDFEEKRMCPLSTFPGDQETLFSPSVMTGSKIKITHSTHYDKGMFLVWNPTTSISIERLLCTGDSLFGKIRRQERLSNSGVCEEHGSFVDTTAPVRSWNWLCRLAWGTVNIRNNKSPESPEQNRSPYPVDRLDVSHHR